MDPVSLAALIVPFLVKGAQAVGGKIWDRVGDTAGGRDGGFRPPLLASVPSGPAPTISPRRRPSPRPLTIWSASTTKTPRLRCGCGPCANCWPPTPSCWSS